MVYSVNHSHATEKPRGENSSRGFVCLVKSNAPQQLLLEYYACSCTIFYIVEWGDFEAEVFSYETNWYIGTIARKNWCSIHGLFFTIQSVGVFADGHNDFGVAYSVGYALSFLIPVNFSAKCFAEYAEWNHGSPSIVYIWSSVAFNNCVVDEVIGRTDGHNDSAACIWIFRTEGVGEGISIEFAVSSFNYDANVCSASLVAFEVHASGTILNLRVNLKIYGSFFIALTYDRSGEGTIDLGEVAIFVYYRYGYGVRFANNAGSRVDGNSFSEVVLNNSQFFFNITDSTDGSIVYFNGDGGTNESVVSYAVNSGCKANGRTMNVSSDNSIAIDTNLHLSSVSLNLQAICINIFRNNFYPLAKSNLIIDSGDRIVLVGGIPPFLVSSAHVENEFFNIAEFSNGEVNGNSLAAAVVQSNANGIVARYEVLSSANIFESVNASFFIPSELEVISVYRVRGVTLDFEAVCMVWSICFSSSFISEWAFTYSVTAIGIGDSELNSITEECTISVVVNLASIGLVGTSEDIAAILYNSDINSVNITVGDLQIGYSVVSLELNEVRSSIVNGVLESEDTSIISLNSRITNDGHTIIWNYSNFFLFCTCIANPCFTGYSINLGIARGYFVIDTSGIVSLGLIWLFYLISTFNFSNFDRSNFNICFCYVNSDRIDYSVCSFSNFTILYTRSSSCRYSVDAVIISITREGYVQGVTAVNKASYLPNAIFIWTSYTQITAFNCREQLISLNNDTVWIFNPYIGVVCQWLIGVVTIAINEIEGEGLWVALSSGCRTNLVINQETAAVSNCVSGSDGNISNLNTSQCRWTIFAIVICSVKIIFAISIKICCYTNIFCVGSLILYPSNIAPSSFITERS